VDCVDGPGRRCYSAGSQEQQEVCPEKSRYCPGKLSAKSRAPSKPRQGDRENYKLKALCLIPCHTANVMVLLVYVHVYRHNQRWRRSSHC